MTNSAAWQGPKGAIQYIYEPFLASMGDTVWLRKQVGEAALRLTRQMAQDH